MPDRNCLLSTVLVLITAAFFVAMAVLVLRPAMVFVPRALAQGELDSLARSWAARQQLYVQGVHCLPGGRGAAGACTVHTEAGEKIDLLCGEVRFRRTGCREVRIPTPLG